VWFEEPGDLLLIKFLFTTGKLSVQVHPDDAYAREHHGSRGKTEMWHVLAAEPGAQIAAGFREPLSPEGLRSAALSGEIEQLLAWHEARAGDTFFIPSGTVHTIGAGLTLCEIQQNSGLTYRLYDYGRPRKLHLEDAARVSRLGPCEPRSGLPVVCPYFTTEKHRIEGAAHFPAGPRQTIVVLEGELGVNGVTAHAGDVLRTPDTVELRGSAAVLRILSPDS
jgi:mannose-6-phosphate isomerase